MKLRIRLATNRDPLGTPTKSFGKHFNPAHPHELRFGEVRLDTKVAKPPSGGSDLGAWLAKRIEAGQAELEVYGEALDQVPPKLGSRRLFDDLKVSMGKGEDTLVYLHGYNTSFAEAVGSAMALESRLADAGTRLNVVLFTWPSDGSMAPFRSYFSDRDDAAASGLAFSRGFQKLAAFLGELTRNDYCGSSIHLLCHSMGNFVLENTLWHLRKNIGGKLPRVFGQVVLASADVDNDALESENKLGRLPEIGRRIHVYYNTGDEALALSDNTKGNRDRLGQRGPKHPLDVPAGVVNVDCSDVVGGLVEHSYYLDEALGDVAATLRGTREDLIARRDYVPSANAYRLRKKTN
jgi:esterase/lipase superfamily enzyme